MPDARVSHVSHPRFADPTDNAAVLQAIVAAGSGWRVAQTARILSGLLILVALLPAGPAGGWWAT